MPFISSVRGSFGSQGRFGRRPNLGTGGTITTAGGYTIHTFLRADTGTNFVQSAVGNIEYLVIAGGGGGGSLSGGGGGAGGYRTGTLSSHAAGTYAVTVGNGGSFGATSGKNHNSTGSFDNSGTQGTNGANSVFSSITSTGGGGGGGAYDNRNPNPFGPTAVGDGLPGGSGGGGGSWGSGGGGGAGGAGATYTALDQGPGNLTGAGSGTGGQGNPGGNGRTSWSGSGVFPGGVYGKADGGAGASSSITGTAVSRAGGGGGGGHSDGHSEPGVGGSGVGGTRGRDANGFNGAIPPVQDTGSGGAGGSPVNVGAVTNNQGANGIVIVRYLQ
jgi:hypothetical protein